MESESRRLCEAIKSDCERVKRLSELPEKDRETKYKKAIDELFNRLKRHGSDLMSLAIYSGLYAPHREFDKWQHEFMDWIKSEDFISLKGRAVAALLEGNSEGFLEGLRAMREKNVSMTTGLGGFIDEEEVPILE